MLPSAEAMARIVLLTLLVASGCARGDRVDLVLRHDRGLVLDEAVQRYRLTIHDVSLGRVVHEVELAPALPSVGIEADRLEPGRQYRARIRSTTSSVCRTGIAIGQSLPFTHRAGDYSVSMFVGCGDSFATAPSAPAAHRALHAAVGVADGALLFGGASSARLQQSLVTLTDLPPEIERYDVESATFTTIGYLPSGRARPAGVLLGDGSVGIAGGQTMRSCEASVTLVNGRSVLPAADLSQDRCLAAAARLAADDTVLIVGDGRPLVGPTTGTAELLDGTMRAVVTGPATFAGRRADPELVPLADGQSALLVGGLSSGTTTTLAARLSTAGCSGGICATTVPFDDGPEGRLFDTSATYVACDDGGGAVFVVGGKAASDGDRSSDLDGIWCYLDRDGAARVLGKVGQLPARRSAHRTIAVAARAQRRRLLVVGGTVSTPVGLDPHADALLLPVDGCTCSVDDAAVETIPVPIGGTLFGHTLAVLPDDTVLLVGGVDLRPGVGEVLNVDATGEAAIFVPEVE
jgi:hypothetical protein